MLDIRHLSKVYPDGTKGLDDVTFSVAPGEFVVIIGLSGSGKSTLLRCINRLIEPSSGQVVLDGVDVTAAKPGALRAIRRDIGMIFQQFNLVKRSSVLTNVLTGRLGSVATLPSVLGIWSAADRATALANLELVGIAAKADSRADALSGGQQQRVGIARALMQNPKLILADEPVASLDPATSHTVLDYLRTLNTERGVTVLCSLHFLSLAREYGTRIIALKDGRLMFDGLPRDIDEARFKAIYGEDAVEVEIR
ncbi:MAG: phosphonate ABC transporter ATP-binding protein [Ardenticatenales bacterium]|nr:phosphonate ABC transporter ATP-binding protein [Ardenticatenales bacterium]